MSRTPAPLVPPPASSFAEARPPRPRLLVSVRDAAEAEAACDGGADLIDVKEPSRGPMGRADPAAIRDVVRAVSGRRPVSVALGEWREHPPAGAVPAGVGYAKLGLAGIGPGAWRQGLARAFAQWPGVRPVAVAYADRLRPGVDSPPIRDVLRWALDAGAAGLLIDTAIKDGRDLFAEESRGPRRGAGLGEWLAHLRACIAQARAGGVWIALAGSLSDASFTRALALGPDILAVRGVACAGGDRGGRVDAARVRHLAWLIATHTRRPGASDRPREG